MKRREKLTLSELTADTNNLEKKITLYATFHVGHPNI